MRLWLAPPLFASLAFVASLALSGTPAHAQNGNPFGQQKGPMGYSLGPLAGKASIIDGSQRKTYGLTNGQTGLKVLSLVDGGLGQKSGLRVGDAILGVGGIFSDKSDPIYQLAAHIERLMARRGGALKLTVWRDGKLVPIKVPIKGLGRKWADKLMEKSYAYLLEQQEGAGCFSGGGSMNAKVSITAIAGLALLASGVRDGKIGKAIKGCRDYLVDNCGKEQGFGGAGGSRSEMGMGGGGNWSQVNWNLGYGAMFLAEYYVQTGDAEVKTKLTSICQAIEKNQESNGGWAHGPGGANALGYTDFAAVTNVVLAGYGAACTAIKYEAKHPVVEKAVNYLIGTASGDGGIGYSQRSGQKGHGDPGRTAAAVLAFAQLGKSRHPFFGRMSSFFKRKMDEVPEGHASPIYHFGMAALGSWECGQSKAFLDLFKYELMMGQQADGSFTARPSKEDKMFGRKSDGMMGPSWPTGTYLLVWNLGRGKLKLFGKRRRR